MLLCQVELRSLEENNNQPTYYIVGRYGFDPDFQPSEDVWINWQVANRTIEIAATVTGRRKEIHVDGRTIIARMNETEKAQFLAIYPDGVETLARGTSLFLLRILVEAKDKDALFQIQAAIAENEKLLNAQKQLPESV